MTLLVDANLQTLRRPGTATASCITSAACKLLSMLYSAFSSAQGNMTIYTTRKIRLAAVTVSIVLWFASLFLPAVALRIGGPPGVGAPGVPLRVDVNSGAWMLFFSLGGYMQGNFAGYANLLLITGWLQLARPNRARTTSAVAPLAHESFASGTTLLRSFKAADPRILLGIALLMTLETFQLKSSGIPYDEGVVQRGYLLHLLPGWYVWVLSIAISFFASLPRGSTETPQQHQTLR